jgi:hypothetical protein
VIEIASPTALTIATTLMMVFAVSPEKAVFIDEGELSFSLINKLMY